MAFEFCENYFARGAFECAYRAIASWHLESDSAPHGAVHVGCFGASGLSPEFVRARALVGVSSGERFHDVLSTSRDIWYTLVLLLCQKEGPRGGALTSCT